MSCVRLCVGAAIFAAFQASAAFAQTPPDFRAIIRTNLRQIAAPTPAPKKDDPAAAAGISAVSPSKPMFPKLDEVGALEISSQARDVVSNVGRAWLVCLRVDAARRPQDYAVFIVDGAIADYRANVLSDRCGAQAYEPFSAAVAKVEPPKTSVAKGGAAKSAAGKPGSAKRLQAEKRSDGPKV